MAVHHEVLETVLRICRERGGWRFGPEEIVRALPHLNASTVRTHIVSRCCVNAPSNHPHRWPYFRRVARGLYEILAALRHVRRQQPGPAGSGQATRSAGASRALATSRVAETAGTYGRRAAGTPSDTVHAVVTRDRNSYVAECLELAVVTQGRTLDELVANLREAIALHLEGEDRASVGVVAEPRISLTYEVKARAG
jgi:predicted RNase H-like HicB family nuclease